MATRSFLKRKIKDIKFNYGMSAVEYFIQNHICENCKEDRLILLNIHHVHGKKIDKFKTLCFNCHMLEHNNSVKNLTYSSSCLEENEKNTKKKEKEKNKIELILSLLNSGLAMRKIMVTAQTSIPTIRKVLFENGFTVEPRKRHRKIIPS